MNTPPVLFTVSSSSVTTVPPLLSVMLPVFVKLGVAGVGLVPSNKSVPLNVVLPPRSMLPGPVTVTLLIVSVSPALSKMTPPALKVTDSLESVKLPRSLSVPSLISVPPLIESVPTAVSVALVAMLIEPAPVMVVPLTVRVAPDAT